MSCGCADPCEYTYVDEEITWNTYEADPNTHTGKTILVYNNDFKYGTLRIVTPCIFKLAEKITFDPDNGDGSNPWYEPFNSAKSARYTTNNAYRLGFIAAITVEADNVIIDLNENTLEQSLRHCLFQRFYSHIELADQPFISGQGPADFGSETISAKCCTIKNGILGMSSHHAIHGNNNEYISVENVKMEKYQVAGISLNGITGLHVCDCCIINDQCTHTLGILSAAIFLRIFAKQAIQYASLQSAKDDITLKLTKLEEAILHVINDIVDCHAIDPCRESTKIFINKDSRPDGNTYGIVINKKGVAVGPFGEKRPENCVYESSKINIKNTKIKDLIVSIQQVVALSSDDSPSEEPSYNEQSVQVDTAGAVFQIMLVLDQCTELYNGNVVADMQLCLARWSDPNLDGHDPALAALRAQGKFGTLNIDPAIVAWGRSDVSYEVNSKTIDSKTLFSDVLAYTGIRYIGNGDSMFHVNKGVFAIRIDTVKTVYICDTEIDNIHNISEKGSECPGNYRGRKDGGHLGQASMEGFAACDSYGIIITASEDVHVLRSCVEKVQSKNGSSRGILVHNDSKCVELKDTHVKDICTYSELHCRYPNKVSIATGIETDSTSCDVDVKCSKVENVKNKHTPYLAFKYVFDNNTTTLTK